MHTDINYLAVLVAAIASFVLGFLWYGFIFKNAWIRGMKVKEGDLSMEKPWIPYLISFGASLAMALALAIILTALGVFSLGGALSSATLLWLGFVALVMARNYAYGNKCIELYSIDAGYVLAEMMLIATILTVWP